MTGSNQVQLQNGHSESSGAARGWLGLSLLALALAGIFALVPVIGRVPQIKAWVDPDWGRRFLTFHVTHALQIWLQGFSVAFFLYLVSPRANVIQRGSAWVLGAGMTLLLGLVCYWAVAADPPRAFVSHYILSIDHPLWLVGLALVGTAMLCGVLSGALVRGRSGTAHQWQASVFPMQVAAVALISALVTLAITAAMAPAHTPAVSVAEDPELREVWFTWRYTALFWGAGHILQFSNITAMIAAWLALLACAGVQAPLRASTRRGLLALFLVPVLAGPVLAAMFTNDTTEYHDGFRFMMRWFTWPVTSIFLIAIARALFANGGTSGIARSGLWSSFALTLTGFGIGAFIGDAESALIPGHYHAALGGVTVAFMALTLPTMERLGWASKGVSERRAAVWQPIVFAVGQAVMAVGLAIAGGYGGSGRKTYGAEQLERSTSEVIGLWVMGIGGAGAVVGGIWFMVLVWKAYRNRNKADDSQAVDTVDRAEA